MDAILPDGVVRLVGALGIEEATTVATTLKAALAGHASLGIDLSDVTDIELPGLQILYSAFLSSETRKQRLVFTGRMQSAVIEKLRAAGVTGKGERGLENAEELAAVFRSIRDNGARDAR